MYYNDGSCESCFRGGLILMRHRSARVKRLIRVTVAADAKVEAEDTRGTVRGREEREDAQTQAEDNRMHLGRNRQFVFGIR